MAGTSELGFDDLHITWTAIPVPEPAGLALALGAALAAAARLARAGRAYRATPPAAALSDGG